MDSFNSAETGGDLCLEFLEIFDAVNKNCNRNFS